MSKPDEFPQPKSADNTKAGIEARLARLLKEKREKQLSRIFERFSSLYKKGNNIFLYYEPRDWEEFFQSQNLAEIIKNLLLLDFWEGDLTLREECQEVLLLLDQNNMQTQKYLSFIARLYKFFKENGIKIPPKLP